jgi:regulatory protein
MPAVRKLNEQKLLEYAMSALGRRALSAGELRDRLNRRAENPNDATVVMAKLKEYGYLDDHRFAESYANARMENQGLGRQRVLRDLRQRRVAAAVAERAVEKAYADSDEPALIEAFLARKYRGKDLPALFAEPAQLASAYRKLRYAGFSGSASMRVLRRYSAQAEDLEGEEERL